MFASVPTPRRELIAAGVSSNRLNQHLRDGVTVAPFRGVHVNAAHAAGLLARARAALATQSARAVVAMQTAAVLLGPRWLPASWLDDPVVHVAVPPADAHRHREGLRLHRRLVGPDDVVVVHGLPSLSVERTLVELARNPELPDLLVVQITDGALRDGRTSKGALLACAGRFPGERYVARARRLIEASREGVASPPETAMRLTLRAGGIDVDVNIEIRDDDGLLLAAGDLGVRRLLLWGEYDGYGPHSERATFRNDRRGDRWLARRGWHVMRFVDLDLRQPERVCADWRQAIADAPARIAALEPRRSPEIAEAQQALGLAQPS